MKKLYSSPDMKYEALCTRLSEISLVSCWQFLLLGLGRAPIRYRMKKRSRMQKKKKTKWIFPIFFQTPSPPKWQKIHFFIFLFQWKGSLMMKNALVDMLET